MILLSFTDTSSRVWTGSNAGGTSCVSWVMFEFCRGGQGDFDITSTFNEPFIWWELWRSLSPWVRLQMLSCARDQRLDQNSTQLTSWLEKKKFGNKLCTMENFSPFLPRGFADTVPFTAICSRESWISCWFHVCFCCTCYLQGFFVTLILKKLARNWPLTSL